MIWNSSRKDRKVEDPSAHFNSPNDIVRDNQLSHDDKRNALNTWEQDAHQLMTASNEGMAGSDEGIDPDDHHHLGEVVCAKDKLGEKPNHKLSQ